MPIPIAFRFGKVLARDAWMHSHFHFLGGNENQVGGNLCARKLHSSSPRSAIVGCLNGPMKISKPTPFQQAGAKQEHASSQLVQVLAETLLSARIESGALQCSRRNASIWAGCRQVCFQLGVPHPVPIASLSVDGPGFGY